MNNKLLGLFSRKKNETIKPEKKKYSFEELNKINEQRWKNLEIPDEFQEELQLLREANVDEDEIEQIMLSKWGLEGKNIDEKGEEFWICGHCAHKIKFKNRDDYIAHHFRVHG